MRYLARPPFAEAQLEWLDDEHLRLTFRLPTRAGQSSVVLGRVQLLRRLVWFIAPPRQHQVRYAGVLAPAAKRRPRVTTGGRIAVQGAWFQDRGYEPVVVSADSLLIVDSATCAEPRDPRATESLAPKLASRGSDTD